MNALVPSSIKIVNRTIEVNTAALPDGIMGMYDPANLRITLAPELQPAMVIETFWHELTHAVFDYIRFNVEMQRELMDGGDIGEIAFDFQETVTEDFSKVFLQVIQDNNLLALQMPQG